MGDGAKSCTDAIRQAIAACRTAGGGRVVVPDGRFVTGPIRLESGVNLHLGDKATLAFSSDSREYLPAVFTRWEGVELMNYGRHDQFLLRGRGRREVPAGGARHSRADVTSRKSEYALLLRGYKHAPITNVRLADCRFDGVAKPDVIEAVNGLEFRNVRVNGALVK